MLRRIVAAGQRCWPEFTVAPVPFVRHLAQHFPAGSIRENLAAIRAEELYLAFACAHGDDRAIKALEAHFGGHIDAPLRGVAHPHLKGEDLRQIARLRLFVGTPGSLPAIAGYSGHGRLAAWLRITARRAVLNATRRLDLPRADPLPSGLLLDGSSRVDPELCYLQDMYGDSFRDAFAEAVASLSDREQTLLRMSYVQQLRVRAIGRMYGVHHATAARWVEAARGALVAATRICLRRRLVVSDAQLDSIIALIRSRIEEDVAWVLQASPSFAG